MGEGGWGWVGEGMGVSNFKSCFLLSPMPVSLGEHDLEQCVASYHHSLVSILPQLVDCGVLHMVDPADVHISLSRTLPIRHHWIQPLVGSIKSRIASHKR